MLAIRLKRVGRSNLAQYRVIIQDSRRHPKRGAVVEYVGTYDPHAKSLEFDKDRVKHFLDSGAQPSSAVAKLLKKDGVKLPKWVAIEKNPKRKIRNPEKLRKNQPKKEKTAEEKPKDESKSKTEPSTAKSVTADAPTDNVKPEVSKEEALAKENTEEPEEEGAASKDEQKSNRKSDEDPIAAKQESEETSKKPKDDVK